MFVCLRVPQTESDHPVAFLWLTDEVSLEKEVRATVPDASENVGGLENNNDLVKSLDYVANLPVLSYFFISGFRLVKASY